MGLPCRHLFNCRITSDVTPVFSKSDMLVQCYQVLRKTRKWYKTIFYHCLDIAAVNAFVLYKEMAVSLGHKPVPQKLFRKCIACQLVGDNSIVHLFQHGGGDGNGGADANPPREAADRNYVEQNDAHCPVPISIPGDQDKANRSTTSRKNCSFCYTGDKKEVRTPWKCLKCNTPLCLQPDRNCFKGHHDQFGKCILLNVHCSCFFDMYLQIRINTWHAQIVSYENEILRKKIDSGNIFL